MKKLLSTTLVAVAFAMVSTVDAKRMATANTASQRVNNIAVTATNVVDMPAAQVQMPILTDVQVALSKENLTEDEREYAVLEFQLLDTNNRIAFRNEQLKDLKLGIFGGLFTASAEQKSERDRLTSIITKLKADKKQIEADMTTLRPVVGDKFAKAVKLLALGVVSTMVASIGYTIDQKYFGSQGTTFVSKNIVEPVRSGARNVKNAAMNKYYGTTGK